ncbi:MAG: histidine phosphatase family protein [Pseudomonadota bacterium]
MEETGELFLIRHAPVAEPGRLYGRTDVDAELDPDAIAPLAARLQDVAVILTSPAQRCRQTAEALWPERIGIAADDRLWEQDFGAHDGMAYADLPDLGPLSKQELADYAPPEGESFRDVIARVTPAIEAACQVAVGQKMALVVHAGVIRAVLGLTLGHGPAALAFDIAPLSLSRFRFTRSGPSAIHSVGEIFR